MLEQRSAVDLLRFITCGSVDDGKSTLIGRLLWETGLLFDDHLAALESDSRRVGTQGGALDLALLLDGLAAEREQGITIDVAYRHFATARRRFIVADTPGHEQYTRNMATGASTADTAVILADARKGILSQTRRHSYIAAALGIRQVALAVNKMDLVGYEEARFRDLEAEYRSVARSIGLEEVTCIPVSALRGDNVVRRSDEMAWFTGPSLLQYLETVEVDAGRLAAAPFRFPVQWVNRPDQAFRGFAGTVVAGSVAPGDRVRLLPSGRETRVGRVVDFDGDLELAAAGQAVTLTLADEVDASRGEVICSASTPAQVGDAFEATVIWMTEEPLLAGRSYLLRCGTRTSGCSFTVIRNRVDVETGAELPTGRLGINEIGLCELRLDQPIAFDPYNEIRETGGFILIDRMTNSTAGAGMLRRALAGDRSVHWHRAELSKAARAAQKAQRPCVVWLTGLSGAGKSTIANLVERQLHSRGYHTYILDGDNLRHGLNADLGFDAAARAENVRRVGEVARLFVDAGLIVLVSLISPFAADRQLGRSLVEDGEFLEVFVDVPLAIAEERDPKGLYRKARSGQITEFTGIASPYEPPEAPELVLDAADPTPEGAAGRVVEELMRRGVIQL